MSLLGLWLRRLAGEGAATLGLVVLVFATALVVGVGPRLLEQRSTMAIHTELAGAASIERNIVVYEFARPRQDTHVRLADVDEAASRLQQAMPPGVARLIGSHSTLVHTALFEVFEGTSATTIMSLRIQPAAMDRITLVEGRLPTGATAITADERPTAPVGAYAYVYEALMPASAVAKLGLAVGDRIMLGSWSFDPANIGASIAVGLQVVGTYELNDPQEEFWIGSFTDQTVAGWRLIARGLETYVETGALLAPDSYDTLVATNHSAGATLYYQYRYFIDADRIAANDVAEAMSSLRRLQGAVPRTGISSIPADTRMTSDLLGLLERHEATWKSAEALLAVIGLGGLAIAGVTLGVVIAIGAGGRRRVSSLLGARGASSSQLLVPAGIEAALLTLPPALLGLAMAVILVPDSALLPAFGLAATMAGLVIMMVLVLVRRASPALPGADQARVRTAGRLTARRLVGEVTLAVAALGGAWLLRERGVGAVASAGGQGGADPMIAGVLALGGIAGGVIAMRLYPLPTRLIGGLVGLRRDLLPVLAVRRATRGGSSAAVLLVLVTTAAVGAFASATLAYVDRSAQLAAWQSVGADFRITSTTLTLPAELDEHQIAGVEAAARAALRSIQTSRGTAWLLAFEPAALAEVVSGTPNDFQLPAEMLATEPAGTLLALTGGLGVGPGDTLEVTINQAPVMVRVARTMASFPGIPAGSPYVAVSAAQLAAVSTISPPPPGIVYLRADEGAGPALRTAAAAAAPWLAVEAQSEQAAAILATPVVGALRVLVLAAIVLSLIYAALAVGGALALAGAAQRDEVAHLRAIGLAPRGHAWLSLLEHGPAALIGYVLGIGLGLTLFAFLLPALGLAAIIGSPLPFPVTVEPAHLLALLGAMLAILTVGWLVGVLAQRDTNPATAIRRGVD